MYISSIPNRNSPPAVLLRESFRENGKVKNRTLANLSHWNPARIEALRRALRGDFDHVEPCEAALGPIFGMLYVLKQIADALGISGVFGNSRLAKLGLFLILARVAHQGSRLSAVRWAADHAVSEVLGLGSFDEDDLYAALDDLCARQKNIEQALFRLYLRRKGAPPRLFLYDVTSSYLEGEQDELGEFGYNRDGKKGKLQIVIGLLTDAQGEPLAVRVFAGNTADPVTVVDQIKILQEQFQVQEFVFVGDRGMVKSKGIQALEKANLQYITALTDPQIRSLLGQKILQLELFSEQICEVEGAGVRYVLRKNQKEAARERHRLEDKLEKLKEKIAARNDSYVSLQRVERDFRALKTGLLEVRPVFVRKESRTRGHVFCSMLALRLSREMERRLRAAFGTTDSNPHAITLPDALRALSSLSLLQYKIDENTTVTKLPQPTANQQQILAALGVSLPATT